MQYVKQRKSAISSSRIAAVALGLGAFLQTGCGDEAEATPTYAEVAAILGTDTAGQSSCSTAGCHGGGVGGLVLEPGTDLIATMVGVPACEAPALNLVEPGDPENSWLYIKLVAEIDDAQSGELIAQPGWGQPGNCPNAAGFGKRMPRVPPFELPEEQLTIVYEWIKAGAPGPM